MAARPVPDDEVKLATLLCDLVAICTRLSERLDRLEARLDERPEVCDKTSSPPAPRHPAQRR